MRDGGRLSAAIEVLEAVEIRHQPVKIALQDWGKAHRFAGSADRAWISGLVLDVLRRRRSLAWMMEDETRRAACLAALRYMWDWPAKDIAAACVEQPHGPGPLTRLEAERLTAARETAEAPAPIRGDYPDWLEPHFTRVFGETRANELAAMASRAPVDLRVNTLKAEPEEARIALKALEAKPFGPLKTTLRIDAPRSDLRLPPIEAHPAFGRGWVEIQDAGSQIAAAQAGDIKDTTVLDLCAGGGGKTLALAAMMQGEGRLLAYDVDAHRMKDIHPRASRAGVRNLEVLSPMDHAPLQGLEGACDVVFVDAPCTGSGTWRRHPDAKWRLREQTLATRIREQDKVLDTAAALVRPGGRIVYVTCSLLMEECEDRVAAFRARFDAFTLVGEPLRLTPMKDGTDGFFAAVLVRAG